MYKKIRLCNVKSKSQPITAVVSLNKIVSVCTLKTKELVWLTGSYERFMFFLSLPKQMEKL